MNVDVLVGGGATGAVAITAAVQHLLRDVDRREGDATVLPLTLPPGLAVSLPLPAPLSGSAEVRAEADHVVVAVPPAVALAVAALGLPVLRRKLVAGRIELTLALEAGRVWWGPGRALGVRIVDDAAGILE